MAWKDVSVMSQRAEFVVLASADGANVSELCRRFGVSRKTGYKWLDPCGSLRVAAGLMPSGSDMLSISANTPRITTSSITRLRNRGDYVRSTASLNGHSDAGGAAGVLVA